MASYLWRPAALSLFVRFARQGALRNVVVTQVSTFRDGETLDIPGRPRVIHAPGHTAGSCALHLPDRDVLLTGDVLATWNVLTGRKGPQIMPGGLNESNARAMESLQRLEGVQAGVLLPGHGEPWRGGTAQALRLAVRAGFS
jgi:glyoxylase-like metal-dependent hydrolase (beta-lactamase superfamily II)